MLREERCQPLLSHIFERPYTPPKDMKAILALRSNSAGVCMTTAKVDHQEWFRHQRLISGSIHSPQILIYHRCTISIDFSNTFDVPHGVARRPSLCILNLYFNQADGLQLVDLGLEMQGVIG